MAMFKNKDNRPAGQALRRGYNRSLENDASENGADSKGRFSEAKAMLDMVRRSSGKKDVEIQSSQSYIPIKDIRNGVIITDDGRYLKILEFTPINFLLRSPMDQTSIIDSFASMLKIAPVTVQFKSLSKKSDTERLFSILRDDYNNEKNEAVRELQQEYMQLISTVASAEGVSRRFFMVVQYDPYMQSADFDYISNTLNNTAHAVVSYMQQCGNTVIGYSDRMNNDDIKQLEILYELLNRRRAESVSFLNHFPQVVKRYLDYTKRDASNPPYIPVTEFFAPKNIEFVNPKCAVIDGKYYGYAYIPKDEYNDHVYAGWLSSLVNAGEGIDVDVFVEKMPKEKAQRSIALQIKHKRAALKGTDDTNVDYDTLQDSIRSGFYLKSGLANNEDLHYISVIVTITGDSAAEVEWKFTELNRILISYDMRIKLCRWQTEQGFLSTLPLCKLDKNIKMKSRRNLLTSSAASSYIFSSYELCDEDGVLFGINRSNRSLAIVDLFNSAKYNNANLAVLGMSGAGKTFLLQCMAMRMRLKGIQVFIIAPDKGHEFKRACEEIGGQYVKIAAGSEHCINIMEIRKLDEEATEAIDGEGYTGNRLALKAQQVGTFVSLIDTTLTMEERQLVDEAIILTYEQFGITGDNDSLIDNSSSTGNYKKMPTLGDLHKNIANVPKLERTSTILTLFTTGSAANFNGQTNVNLDNKYIILDLTELSAALIAPGMFMALDFVWDKVKEDRTKRKAVFIDEVWKLIGPDSTPLAASFVLSVFKLIRGYGGAGVAATQDLTDFFALEDGKFGKGIINNAKTKIILKLEKPEALSVQETLGLTDSEVKSIIKFARGEGLVFTNSNNVYIDFKASPLEEELITTDRVLLSRIAEKKRLAKMGK